MASSNISSARLARRAGRPLSPGLLSSKGLRLALFFIAVALCGVAVGSLSSPVRERAPRSAGAPVAKSAAGPDKKAPPPAEKNVSAPASAALPAVPASVMEADFQTLDGGSLRLSGYAGKVLVLDLWATWCGPCRQEIPHLVQLGNEYRARGVEVVGLSTEDPAAAAPKVRDFAGEFKINYTLGWAGGELARALMQGNSSIPQTFVITRDGRLVKRLIGFNALTGPTQLREAVEQALRLGATDRAAEGGPAPGGGVRRLTPAELRDALARAEAVVLDVRSEGQYEAGHIRGALWIPEGELSRRAHEIPRDKLVVTYCA